MAINDVPRSETGGARVVDPAPAIRGRQFQLDSRLALLVLTAAVIVARWVVLNGNGWAYDDNLQLVLANRDGFGEHWLFATYFQHFGLAYQTIISIQNKLMPIDYRWALAFMLAFLAGAVVMLDRTLRLLVDSEWVPLLAAGALGLSVLLGHTLEWFASGLQSAPTLFFDLLCLYGYLRYQAEPRGRWIATSAGSLGAGLLFYEKPAFTLVYIVLIRVATIEQLRPRALWTALRGEWRIWLAYGAVIVLWAIGLKHAGGGGSLSHSPSLSAWASFFKVFWALTLLPGVFGLTLPAAGLTGVQLAGAIALEVALLAAIVVSVRRRPRSWRIWAVLAIAVVANGLLVGQERIYVFGPTDGDDTRYWIDFAWLVPLLVGLAFARPAARLGAVSRPAGHPWRVSLPLSRGSLTKAAGVCALAIAYVVVTQVNAAAIQNSWLGPQARAWEQRITSGLAAASRNGTRPVLADGTVPWFIIESAFAPFNALSYVVPRYVHSAQVDGPLTGPLVTADPTGAVRPAKITPLRRLPLPPSGCMPASVAGPPGGWHVPAESPSLQGQLFLMLRSASPVTSTLPLFVDTGTGYSPVPDRIVRLTPRGVASIAWLGPAPPRRFALASPSSMPVCLRQLELVVIQAR